MFLYCYVLVGASIVWTTTAKSASNQAVSSQSYDRRDVPLSYKHNVVHMYTTSESYSDNNPRNHHQTQPQFTNYRNIQYAPLPLQNAQRENHKERLYTEAKTTVQNDDIDEDNNSKLNQAQRTYLEPKPISTPTANYIPRQLNPYVHGYNVNTQGMNKKIVHRAPYKNDPRALIKNNQLKVNYFQPQSGYQEPEYGQPVQTTEAAATYQNFIPNPVNNVQTYKSLHDMHIYNPNIASAKENISSPGFYVKPSKVALNVARALNIARSQHKATINMNSSFRKLPSLPENFFFNSLISQRPTTQTNATHRRDKYVIHRSA